MFYIYPYMAGSKSVKKLKELLGAKIIKLENSKYRPKASDIVINYGNSRIPSWLNADVAILNHPDKVRIASNKLDTFVALQNANVPTVPFTTNKSEAERWLSEGTKVFVRTILNGHSGAGIEVVQQQVSSSTPEIVEELNQLLDEYYNSTDDPTDQFIIQELQKTLDENEVQEDVTVPELSDAPLYTKGVSNAGEYRVHVADGEVILYQKKSRKVDEEGNVITPDGEEADVRNLASNWVYRTGNLRRLERVEDLAVLAINELGLDFGSVDIIMDTDGEVYVLEVNTASGLGNTDTQVAYDRAFRGLPPQLQDVNDEE